MKKFSKFQIASFKRTAQNVYPNVRRKEKLLAEIEAKKKELESIQLQIDAYQAPIKEATGGYTTEDLIVREVVEGIDKNGKSIKTTVYKLRYPDTIVPPDDDANVCLTFDPNEVVDSDFELEDAPQEPHIEMDEVEIDPFDMRLS